MRTEVDPPYIFAESHDSFEILPGKPGGGLVILCDHAANALPDLYGTLGLAACELERHIAYDIGVAAVVRLLSATLGAPAVLTRYSRLLIDPNRGEDDPTLVMRLSDGAIIPGNRHLDSAEREKRIARYYRPYHDAITRVIDQCETACTPAGRPLAILGMHSFTESWKGVQRPWMASVLWERDRRLAGPLLNALRAQPGLIIGENQPYPGQYEGDTLWRHGTERGLAHAIIEIRQDLIAGESGQQAWAERLAGILRDLDAGRR